jgi:hypothetical protein
VALAERPDGPVELPGDDSDGDLGEARLFGADLFGGATPTGPLLMVDATEPVPDRAAAPLFRDDDAEEPRSPFGASRHAAHPARRPRPDVKLRPQPVGAALTVTVLGAAAAVTAVVAPPVAVESTSELPPVQKAAPDPGPDTLTGLDPVAAPAPEQPTVQVSELVSGVTAEMEKLTPAVEMSFTRPSRTAPRRRRPRRCARRR